MRQILTEEWLEIPSDGKFSRMILIHARSYCNHQIKNRDCQGTTWLNHQGPFTHQCRNDSLKDERKEIGWQVHPLPHVVRCLKAGLFR